MIRLIVWGLLALLGAGLAMFAVSEQGYVAVHWSGWLVETSVSFLALLLVLWAMESCEYCSEFGTCQNVGVVGERASVLRYR